MPGNWDPEVYRARAKQWREAAEKLPDSQTRKGYFALAEGYERLANIIEEEKGVVPQSQGAAGGE